MPLPIQPDANAFSNPILIIILVVLGVFVLAGIALLVVRMVVSRRPLPDQFLMTTMLVTVPKEQIQQKENEQSKSIVEQLQTVEGMFANLGGLRAQRGMKHYFRGRTDHFSLEMIAHEGLISFYITVPQYLEEFMAQQIHAHYPHSQIEPVDDFNIFSPQSSVAATALLLKKRYIFPIQSYRKLETDSMNAITNSLSKLQEDEAASVQIVLRSARGEWHAAPARVATEMQQGKSLAEAMRSTGKAGWVGGIAKMVIPSSAKQKEQELLHQQKLSQRRLSPMEEEIVKRLEEKTSKAGFDVNIRIVAAAPTAERANRILQNITDSFGQFSGYEYGNGFKRGGSTSAVIRDYIYRRLDERHSFVLNAEEMTSLYHFPLPTSETPNIRWLTARHAPPPVNMPREGLLLGESVYRGHHTPVRMRREDRRRHVYVIGKSGVGKSVLLQNMVIQDIQAGEGVCVIDPHGDLVDGIMAHIPRERADDVIYFDPSDVERPMGLNMLEFRSEEQKDFAVQDMIAIFYKLFPAEMIGPMFEHNMRNVMLTLMADTEQPGTIVEIPRMFTDKAYQQYKLQRVRDPIVRAFWEKEVAQTSDFHKSEMLGYLISKVGRFVENEMMRNIIGQPRSGFDFREVMDKQKVLLVNLSKGKTGEVNSALLGLIIVSKLQMAALSRADTPESERKDFYLYIDEFQNFVTDSIATILSEARKYKLNLTIAHQYLGQLVQGQDTKIRDAVFGNAGTMVAFRVGVEDAETVAQEFAPVFSTYDVINMDKYTAYLKLLIDNTASKAFNMRTMPPTSGESALAASMKQLSRLTYGKDRSLVAAEILERSRVGASATPPPAPIRR